MSDTELIVPVEVHALLVNNKVRTAHPFYRYQPSFHYMLGSNPNMKGRGAAEPEPFSGGNTGAHESFEGVHVQWQLPEALTDGVVDPSGQTNYPLVPNRWLVVRYAQLSGGTAAPVGWVVHSDHLHSDDPDAWDGRSVINSFVNPRAEHPEVDWLGRIHSLADGPWQEPEARELFLTAVGAGLPTFAAFEPYHENVFSMHDDLMDLKGPGDSYPPNATLSYLVCGWYSDPGQDILRQAPAIPGLLPPDGDGSPAELLAALGWTTAGRSATELGGLGAAAGHGVERILDPDEESYYLSANAPAEGSRIVIDLGSVQQIGTFRVLLGDPDDEHLLPKVRVQTSVDNQNWPDRFHRDYEAGTPVIDYRPPEPCEARYLQLWITEPGTEPVAVRSARITAAPKDLSRTLYSGTALGLGWERFGDAPEHPDYPENGELLKVALGHSTGEAAEALIDRQLPDSRHASLVSALFHGTLDTFDGADGERDLAEVTHSSWFAGSDGGADWQIVPRESPGPDAPPARRGGDLTAGWLTRLNADQVRYDAALNDLTASQWRVWALYWLQNQLSHLPEDERPADLPADFEAQCERQLHPETGDLVKAVKAHRDTIAALLPGLPPTAADGQDPQEVIDDWATDQGLPAHLQLRRLPQGSFYKPADPVLLVEGTGGGTVPLTRDADNPLPCRLPSALLRGVLLDRVMTPPPGDPADPGIPELPAGCAALLKEFALLDRAARTRDGDRTALHALAESPATHAEGPLAEYTAPWLQPWLPMFLMWKLSFFPTPYRTEQGYHWTFQAPDPGSGLDSYGYGWNGDGTLVADFESEGDVLNRLFRGRAYLAPTTVYVLRAQLARYLAGYPGADRRALAALSDELAGLDVLSQSLDGFNDWLLQLDGGAQVPSEGDLAELTGEQNHVPDGAGGPQQRRFQPVRAGQFFFTDLRIVDRFGRAVDLVTSGDGGNWYDQYPVRAASVTPSEPLYTEVELINPERFIQLPPRLLQESRLTFAPVPAAPAPAGQGTPLAGWLLANYLDQTLGVYGPAGQALGELRVVTTVETTRETRYTPLPHSPYSGLSDLRFADDHPELHRFVAALDARPDSEAAFKDLLKTIDTSMRTIVDPAAGDDRLPARLIGRPVALVRADLTLDLQGPLLTDPSWATILEPPAATYPEDSWAIRLGDPYDLDDGLIGYYSADRDREVDYGRLSALHPAGSSGYVKPVDAAELDLPARTADRAVTRRVALLVHPHLPVHATTDILPVQELRLDAEQVHQALAAIRASFRLNPLLATTRSPRTATSSIPGHGTNTPQAGPVERILDGRLDTWYQTGAAPRAGDTVTVDLGEVQPVTGIDLYFGEAGGGRIAPAKTLRASEDGEEWLDLAEATASQAELHWHGDPAGPPLTARYLQLVLRAATYTTVIRSFQVTPQDDPVVFPPLSARYGTWSWAQPQATAADVPDWDERGLIPADHLTHPDDALPTARAGYLQLHPATPQDDPAPEPAPQP
ncbi:discoidin domain-containing protein [Kitasatospora sp. NPDC048545]|uniref:discoidin domain-containing protein n=1 Tax=Kitasatospora sp. NPDC048545 TaxID=3157208 RepID=UPI0033EDB074